MKLATLKNNTRDGQLVVVSRSLDKAVVVNDIAATLQAAIDNWRASDLFDEKERVTLEVTDAVTQIANQGISNELYCKVAEFLSEKEIDKVVEFILTL